MRVRFKFSSLHVAQRALKCRRHVCRCCCCMVFFCLFVVYMQKSFVLAATRGRHDHSRHFHVRSTHASRRVGHVSAGFVCQSARACLSAITLMRQQAKIDANRKEQNRRTQAACAAAAAAAAATAAYRQHAKFRYAEEAHALNKVASAMQREQLSGAVGAYNDVFDPKALMDSADTREFMLLPGICSKSNFQAS